MSVSLPNGSTVAIASAYGSAKTVTIATNANPTVLTSTPTTLDLLALRPDRPRFDSLKQVVTWSETLTDPVRSRLFAAYGVPVLDTYGCGECLFLSNGCRTRRL